MTPTGSSGTPSGRSGTWRMFWRKIWEKNMSSLSSMDNALSTQTTNTSEKPFLQYYLQQISLRYKMCPFDHCSQRPKHGGSETRFLGFCLFLIFILTLFRLGSWGSWEGLSTGAGSMKYSVMKFTGGQVSDQVFWVTEMTNNYRVVGMVQLVQLLSTFTAEQRTLSRRCPSLTSIKISITFILWINIGDICDKTVQVRVRDALHNTCGVPPPWRISWWALGFDFDNYLSGILHWTLDLGILSLLCFGPTLCIYIISITMCE